MVFYSSGIERRESKHLFLSLETQLISPRNMIQRKLLHQNDYIFSLACSSDFPQLVAIGFRSGRVIVFDFTSNSVFCDLKGHTEEVHAVKWHKNLLATSSRDKTIRVWKLPSGDLVKEMRIPSATKKISGHQKDRLWLTCQWVKSADKHTLRLVSGSYMGQMYLWEWKKANVNLKVNNPVLFQNGHTRPIFNILADSDHILFTISMDRKMIVWDLESRRMLSSIDGLGGYVYRVRSCPIETGTFAAGIGDNTIRVWKSDFSSNETVWKGIKSRVSCIAWCPTQIGLLAYGCEDGQIGVYDGSSKVTIQFGSNHRGFPVVALGFRQNEDQHEDASESLAKCISNQVMTLGSTAAPQTTRTLWSLSSNGVLLESDVDHPERTAVNITRRLEPLLTGRASISSFALSDSHLALGQTDGSVSMLSVDPLECMQSKLVHSKATSCITWRDASLFASASIDGTIVVHSNTLDTICRFEHTQASVHDLAWSNDLLATASSDGTAQVWNISTKTGIANYRNHQAPVSTVCWTDKPNHLITGGEDQAMRLWDYTGQGETTPPQRKSTTRSRKKQHSPMALDDIQRVLDKVPVASNASHQILVLADETHMSLKNECSRLEKEKKYSQAARVHLVNGDIVAALKLVVKHNVLSPEWLALAPLAGLETWMQMTRLYAKQLERKGDWSAAAGYYQSMGEIPTAIDCYMKGHLFVEALALAQIRYSESDPILIEIRMKWAQFLEDKGEYDWSARVYLAANEPTMGMNALMKSHDVAIRCTAMRMLKSYSREVEHEFITETIQMALETTEHRSILQKTLQELEFWSYLLVFIVSFPVDEDQPADLTRIPIALQKLWNSETEKSNLKWQQWFRALEMIPESVYDEVEEELRHFIYPKTYICHLSRSVIEWKRGYAISACECWIEALESTSTDQEALFQLMFPSGLSDETNYLQIDEPDTEDDIENLTYQFRCQLEKIQDIPMST